MNGLFVSYAHDDAAIVGRLTAALREAGHLVWWDQHLVGGTEYSREIEEALDRSRKVLVLWSSNSTQSPWVRDEAAAARDAGKLVPISIDGTSPPMGFRQFHTLSLVDWLAAPSAPLPVALVNALAGGESNPVGGQPATEECRQQIEFCRARDGVTLAYSRIGEGLPLVKSGNWLNHLEYEMESPIFRPWIDELSRGRSLLRYDARGNGMSDWRAREISFDLLVDDFESVVDASGLDKFDLVGISQGCPVAIAFAVRHPKRVKRMVLINGFAVGWRHSHDDDMIESWQAMITLAKTGWGKNNPAFRQLFTSQIFPDATREQATWWNELQLKSATAENAVRYMELFGQIDVRAILDLVAVPTLVMHCRDDQFVPFEAGRYMASRIRGAQFVALESSNHIPFDSDAVWPKLAHELHRFLDTPLV